MVKKILGFCFALLCSFSICSCEYYYGQESNVVSEDIFTESVPEVSAEQSDISEEISVEESIEESMESEPEVSEEETSEAEGTIIIGKTENGFTIKQINGVYYIDGTLIVNKTYPLPKDYPQWGLTAETLSALAQMQNAAAKEGLSIRSCSDFRSYENQEYLYNAYCNRDGKAQADRYSARPGHSEHQSGMAIDINTASPAFTNTEEAKWLKNNCVEFGFILRYPENKEEITGYLYESWHIRYVGKELAQKLYLGDGEFTTLEEYFGITSVYSD